MTTMTSDTSASALLTRFRGLVTDAYLTYADMARIEVTDADGGLWHFGTWEAEYSPTDPESLLGKTVSSHELDKASGVLTLGFLDGTSFAVTPDAEEDDDAEHWELFTPENLFLAQGPIGRWELRETDGG
jgi:hypothetical protein